MVDHKEKIPPDPLEEKNTFAAQSAEQQRQRGQEESGQSSLQAEGQGHGHGHGRGTMAERALWIALGLNASFLVLEVVVGLWSNSLALLSDAGHMISDVAALALALVAERLARAKPAGQYTFGLRRVPILGALGNGLTLLAIVAIIFWEAGQRLLHPPPIAGVAVLIAGIAGLLVNLLSAWWLHRSSSKSLNIRGALLHLLADALGSLGAIAAAIVMMTTGWMAVDALISILIGLLILGATWPLLRDSVKVLLEAAPSRVEMDSLRRLLRGVAPQTHLLDLHVWELNSGQIILTAHLSTPSCLLNEVEALSDRLRQTLRQEFGIEHATFEWRTPESSRYGCEEHEDPPSPS